MIPEEVKPRKLIVFGIGDTAEEEFADYFKKFGDVEDFIVLRAPGSLTPRGYGFVVFRNMAGVNACFAEQAHFLGGRNIIIKNAY